MVDGKKGFQRVADKAIQNMYDIDVNDPTDYVVKTLEVMDDVHKMEGTQRSKPTTDFKSFYRMDDDMYGTPTGYDVAYEEGRVSTKELMMARSTRLGVVNRMCNGTANDVLRNMFDFVDIDDINKVHPHKLIRKWMLDVDFWGIGTRTLDYSLTTGQAGMVFMYPGDKMKNMSKVPKSRLKPNFLQCFSANMMTPTNINDKVKLDYDKQKWKMRTGIRGDEVHEDRIYVLEMDELEGELRGLGLPEPCWIPVMCYLNMAYYLLKAGAQLGNVIVGIQTESPFPTEDESNAYLGLLKKFQANNFYLMGKGAQLQVISTNFGKGITEYLEFLKEDISARCIIPKNQLFGRSESGGIGSGGAIISKEDYLGSNISVKQLHLTRDFMYILTEMVGFKEELEGQTIRWNIDLHKSLEQRLTEQIMQEQLVHLQFQTKQLEIVYKLAQMEFKQIKENPQLLLQDETLGKESNEKPKGGKEVEGVKEKKEPEKDFMPSDTKYLDKFLNKRIPKFNPRKVA